MVDNLALADGQEGIKSFVEKRKPVWSHSTTTVHWPVTESIIQTRIFSYKSTCTELLNTELLNLVVAIDVDDCRQKILSKPVSWITKLYSVVGH